MTDHFSTADFSGQTKELRPVLSFDDGYFLFGDMEGFVSSSGRKRIFHGTYMQCEGKRCESRPIAAVAVFFITDDISAYIRELHGLSAGANLGVGPKVIKGNVFRRLPGNTEEGEKLPLIIEEDLGVSLEDVLSGKPIPRNCEGNGVSIAALSPDDRSILSSKIAFDVVSQVMNIHKAGFYHRDIRAANFAVRWISDEDPRNVRATMLDLEFLSDAPRGSVRERTYFDPLFVSSSWQGEPTPCEQDAGYLTVLLAEVWSLTLFSSVFSPTESVESAFERKDVPLCRALAELLSDPKGFFSVQDHFARPIGLVDVRPFAQGAGLKTIGEIYGSISRHAGEIAEEITHHAGYVDAYDIETVDRSPQMIIERESEEALARQIWRDYCSLRLQQGFPLEYEHFEDQPKSLRQSNIAQAQDIRRKVNELGYEIVGSGTCPADRRVRSLSERQVEYLAEQEHIRWVNERIEAGWTQGERSAERKTTPYLVPWEKLDESVKDYDRDPVRKLIETIESAGLEVMK